MAAVVDVPVVNLLSDRAHPTQAVADFLTLQELFGALDGRRLVYVGDGNNVTASLAYGAALSGVELIVASPPGYELDELTVERARNLGATIELVGDPHEAVAGADAVYTDVWTSMGQEAERERPPRRLRRVHRRRRADGGGGGAGVVPPLPPRAPGRRGRGVGHRRAPERGLAAGRQPHARRSGRARATCCGEPTDGDVREAAAAASHRPLLEEQAISSQAQLVEMLAADGVIATQATVSRDLEELGAVKVRIPGGAMAYAIPELATERTAPDDHLRRVMGEFVVEVAHSGNLVVLRTPPGSAHVVASALDRAGLADVLGTVAGDDTIILVCASATGGGAAVAGDLATLAGL